MRFALLVLGVRAMLAQDVTGIADSAQRAVKPNTVVLTLTAAQGDGSTCKITKIAGATINATVACSSSDGKSLLKNETLQSTGTTAFVQVLGFGASSDILCLLLLNPTAAAVTMGSVGPAPPVGVAWSCTTNITAGGQTPIVSGSVVWP